VRLPNTVRAQGLWPRLLAAAVLVLAACERNTIAPESSDPELRGRAVALDVDLDSFTVRQASGSGSVLGGGSPMGLNIALLGHNEVTTTISNVTTQSLSSPHRVRIKFDLALTNNLSGADLVPATFPEPPTQQVVAFPFSTEPASWYGLYVKATGDWNGTGQPGSGAPWNFFNNDNHCFGSAPPSDCYRWEAFGPVLGAGATSTPHQVGFDISPHIRRFRVYVVVAADIRERSLPAGTGGIAGTVTSPGRGALADVAVSGGGHSATTGATGLFVLSGLTPGTVSLTLANLPDGCTAPATNATVVAGEITTSNIVVSCPSAGAVEGQVLSGGAGLTGVTVRVNGTAFSATTGSEGGYHIDDVPAGLQQLSLAGLPANCVDPGAQSVVIVAGGTAHFSFNVTCPSGAPERIVATSVQTGNAELYVLNIDGSGPIRLTFTPESELQPTWSPDKERIVFLRRSTSGTFRERLVIISADGASEMPLTDLLATARNPSWSADGSKIAFTCSLTQTNELCVVNADGTDLHALVDGNGESFVALFPDWDPASDRIAFLADAANPDGSFFYSSSSGASLGGVTTNLDLSTAPAFSPNGTRLAFARLVTDNDIYVVDAAGGTAVPITSGAGAKNSPTWTRDGSNVIYESGGDLYRVSAAGGGSVQLTSGGMYLTPHVR
jgi:TolB protein